MIRGVLCCLLAAVPLLVPSAVLAHSDLTSADPGPDDVISEVPDTLVGHFTQNLDPRIQQSFMEVRDASGKSLAKGGIDESASDERTMRVTLPDLAPGVYEVRWQTLSTEDGELDRDSYSFTVVEPSPEPPTSPPATGGSSSATTATPIRSQGPSASPSPDASPAADATQVAIPIVVGLVFVLGLAAWLLRRRTAG